VSRYRREALIAAPVAEVWELVGDPAQHPRWWPRIVEVRGQSYEVNERFAQVTRGPLGRPHETTMVVESRDELHEIAMRCLDTGTIARWELTEARGETFVAIEMGMDPSSPLGRVFDATLGRRFFQSWADESIDGLKRAAS
jgi:uncharacterized protein YndB with AHSA1/START domain